MSPISRAPEPAELARFRDIIIERLGLQFDDGKSTMLARVLAAHGGRDCAAYLDLLASQATAAGAALHRLAVDLTVTETYFFRNAEQIHAYAAVALPAGQQRAMQEGGKIRVLSAGCASGEEPYTLAIAARELAGLPPASLDIRAVDANPAMLAKAAQARYSQWSLRELSGDMLARWFARDGEAHVLHDTVRQTVRFDMRNLAQPDNELWAPCSYDVVFCRNVLMYFSPPQAQAAVARIAAALAPGGYLFLGHAETLRGLSNDFHLCHTHGTFYYQRKPRLGMPCPPAAMVPAQLPPPPLRLRAPLNDNAWVDAIAQASRRIHTLADAPPGALEAGLAGLNGLAGAVPLCGISGNPAKSGHPENAGYAGHPGNAGNQSHPGQPDLRLALACLHNQQFAQSLAHIAGMGVEHRQDPDVLLLEAISLSQSGALQEAVDVCHALLAVDELNAGAQYVLALCREESGDGAGALRHYRSAAYLDPGFAMARLHIGLLERRMGEPDAARRDLRQALELLRHEDTPRLLLFGGGFPRPALLALCQAELNALGAAP